MLPYLRGPLFSCLSRFGRTEGPTKHKSTKPDHHGHPVVKNSRSAAAIWFVYQVYSCIRCTELINSAVFLLFPISHSSRWYKTLCIVSLALQSSVLSTRHIIHATFSYGEILRQRTVVARLSTVARLHFKWITMTKSHRVSTLNVEFSIRLIYLCLVAM